MKVVMHVCCGVCSAGAADSLIKDGHQVIGFFYNPNIHPEEEYEKRLATANRAAKELNFQLVVPPYLPEDWFKKTESLEYEPEGGQRCRICFEMRLQKTYECLLNCKADAFTTTLTISPHKSAAIVNAIGREIGGNRFLEKDFKKKEGFKRTLQLASKWSLYRQDYCGCLYSMKRRRDT